MHIWNIFMIDCYDCSTNSRIDELIWKYHHAHMELLGICHCCRWCSLVCLLVDSSFHFSITCKLRYARLNARIKLHRTLQNSDHAAMSVHRYPLLLLKFLMIFFSFILFFRIRSLSRTSNSSYMICHKLYGMDTIWSWQKQETEDFSSYTLSLSWNPCFVSTSYLQFTRRFRWTDLVPRSGKRAGRHFRFFIAVIHVHYVCCSKPIFTRIYLHTIYGLELLRDKHKSS